MSKRSEQVKAWRKRTKERIVVAFGGICCVCKDEYPSELYDLHHVTDDKEFSFGSIRASIRSWEKIVIELRKCVLVCSNCHRLIHNGYTEVPLDALRFDEEYAEYRKVIIKEPKNVCSVCGKLCFNKFCSQRCHHINQRVVTNRPPRDKIIEMVGNLGYVATGKHFGVSDNAVRKWIK